jgi:2-polyprenyl-6-methoxyphenol hydroxylase-like FAD-dependent oxidoreductase
MLKKSGHSVRILERYRKDELQDQGAGLRIGPDVQAFLSTYVPHSSEIYSLTCKGIIELDASGGILRRSPAKVQYTSWGLIHRCLRERFEDLIGKDGNSSYEYDCAVEKVEEQGDKILVTYITKGQQLTVEADLVIGADGASSRVRQCLLPHIQRTYAGYVLWRGLVGENDLSEAGRDMFVENASFHLGNDFMILCYPIPDETLSLDAGNRFANWGWYQSMTESELDDLMNGIDGKKHKFTLPMGKVKPELVENQYTHAKETLPPQFVDLITKTALPFIQVVTDVLSPQNMFFGGKVVLIGDAAAGARQVEHIVTIYAHRKSKSKIAYCFMKQTSCRRRD